MSLENGYKRVSLKDATNCKTLILGYKSLALKDQQNSFKKSAVKPLTLKS
jgi:hypothetical protein